MNFARFEPPNAGETMELAQELDGVDRFKFVEKHYHGTTSSQVLQTERQLRSYQSSSFACFPIGCSRC